MKLIDNNELVMVGPIRQELLSGIREEEQFLKLRDYLDAFPDFPISKHHYVEAAKIGNVCRKVGVQASSVDFLIASVSILEGYTLYTTDKDFDHIAGVVPLRLFHTI